MKPYSISVADGKVVGNSDFYLAAYDMLEQECRRICAFTDMLDRDPAQKKERMAEYKCAKYRYAAVSLIQSTVVNNNRCRMLHNLEYTHYLLMPFDEIFKTCPEYLAAYENAPANEKPDFSLYYAMLAFAESDRVNYTEKLKHAGDWETVELEERIGGLLFSAECLHEAWSKRGGEPA